MLLVRFTHKIKWSSLGYAEHSMSSGIFYAMAVVGPAIGYVVGGQFLNIYIDAPQENPAM